MRMSSISQCESWRVNAVVLDAAASGAPRTPVPFADVHVGPLRHGRIRVLEVGDMPCRRWTGGVFQFKTLFAGFRGAPAAMAAHNRVNFTGKGTALQMSLAAAAFGAAAGVPTSAPRLGRARGYQHHWHCHCHLLRDWLPLATHADGAYARLCADDGAGAAPRPHCAGACLGSCGSRRCLAPVQQHTGATWPAAASHGTRIH